jgi:hypothetical protein
MIEVNEVYKIMYKYFEHGLAMLVHPFYRGIEGEILYYKLDRQSINVIKEYNHAYSIPWSYNEDQFDIPICYNPSEKSIDIKPIISVHLTPQNFIRDNEELTLSVSSRASYFRVYALSKYYDVVDKLQVLLTHDLGDWSKNAYDLSYVSPETGLGVEKEFKIKTLFIPFE